MTSVGIRELSQHTSQIVSDLSRTGESIVVTNAGKPVAVINPVNQAEFEDFILANAPKFTNGYGQADKELSEGKTTSLEDLREEID